MKRLLIALLILVGIFCFNDVWSQGLGGKYGAGGGWGHETQYGKTFDPKMIEKHTGIVSESKLMPPVKGMSNGILLMIRTSDKEDIIVHVGPEWFTLPVGIKFAVGDVITVTGSKIISGPVSTIMATEITRGNYILTLRSPVDGFPVWGGWRRK